MTFRAGLHTRRVLLGSYICVLRLTWLPKVGVGGLAPAGQLICKALSLPFVHEFARQAASVRRVDKKP